MTQLAASGPPGSDGNGVLYVPMHPAVPGCGSGLDKDHLGSHADLTKLTGAWDVKVEEAGESVPLISRKRRSSKEVACIPCRGGWFCAIDPGHSLFLNVWDAMMCGLILTVAFLAPVQTVFELPTTLDHVINTVLDSAFAFDTCLQFFVMVPDPNRPSVWSAEPMVIAQSYLTGWFWFDLTSILPLQQIAVMITPNVGSNTLHLLRALRLIKLLRIARFSRLAQRWHASVSFSFAFIAILQNFSMVAFCCHWMACMWAALAFRNVEESTWLSALVQNKDELFDSALGQFDIYVMSLYWAVVTITSIGYGDIIPQNRLEYLTATFCMSMMASLWAYVIGAICGILSTLQPHEIDFKRSLDDLNLLISERSLPREVRHRLRRYFHEAKELSKHRIERKVIARMSPALQGEVALLLHSQWLERIWYFKGLTREIVIWAARHLAMMLYTPQETIKKDRTIFIIRRGLCARRGKILSKGDVWGEDCLVSNATLRDSSKTVALSYLDVCMLSHCDLADIIDKSPEAKVHINWARIRIALTRGVIRIAQELTRLQNHPSTKGDFEMMADSGYVRMLLISDILSGQNVTNRLQDYATIDRARSTRRRVTLQAPDVTNNRTRLTRQAMLRDSGVAIERARSTRQGMSRVSVLQAPTNEEDVIAGEETAKQMEWMMHKMTELATAQATVVDFIREMHSSMS